jgi:hypothetical protein
VLCVAFVRRNDHERLWKSEKTGEGTKGDEDGNLNGVGRLAGEVPQSVAVGLVVEMNPSLSAIAK